MLTMTRWQFNTSTELRPLPSSDVFTDADMSVAAYIPMVDDDGDLYRTSALCMCVLCMFISATVPHINELIIKYLNGKVAWFEILFQTELDYGSLLCFGFNSLGRQSQPCVFTILPAGVIFVGPYGYRPYPCFFCFLLFLLFLFLFLLFLFLQTLS